MLHGGDLSQAMALHGGTYAGWLDLSTGINPHAWPCFLPDTQRMQSGAQARLWTSLPNHADLSHLLASARKAYHVPANAGIVAAPGTQALIQWLPVLAPAGDVAIYGPTYGEHATAWHRAGRAVTEITALEQWQNAGVSARNLVLVNPNNPDGRLLGLEAAMALGEAAKRRGGWLVVDESFIDTVPCATAASLTAQLPIITLRSFGKFYGLAGLRLGFAIAGPAITGQINQALGAWAVAGPALALGTAALADEAWALAMRAQLQQEAADLDAVLSPHGRIIGGTSLYRLLQSEHAAMLHQHLAHAHVWTRRFAWNGRLLRFGLPGSAAALARLSQALARFSSQT